jgi:hypothetical protein
MAFEEVGLNLGRKRGGPKPQELGPPYRAATESTVLCTIRRRRQTKKRHRVLRLSQVWLIQTVMQHLKAFSICHPLANYKNYPAHCFSYVSAATVPILFPLFSSCTHAAASHPFLFQIANRPYVMWWSSRLGHGWIGWRGRSYYYTLPAQLMYQWLTASSTWSVIYGCVKPDLLGQNRARHGRTLYTGYKSYTLLLDVPCKLYIPGRQLILRCINYP